jgi:hypothetical protein
MKAPDVFGIVVRTIGLWEIVQGLNVLPALFTSPMAAVAAALPAVIGAILFFGANGFVRSAYNQGPKSRDFTES